jgi:hypothetical protein
MQFLNLTFLLRWIGSVKHAPWPPRSRDLAPMNFRFRGPLSRRGLQTRHSKESERAMRKDTTRHCFRGSRYIKQNVKRGGLVGDLVVILDEAIVNIWKQANVLYSLIWNENAIVDFDSRQGKVSFFSTPPRSALGPTHTPIQKLQGAISPGLKRQGRESAHSPPPPADVKNSGVIPIPPILSWHSA